MTLIEARLDFCTETVFSHPSKNELVATAARAEYDVVLHVVMVTLQLSRERVTARAASGGHTVPPDKLAPRWERLWPLVADSIPDCYRAVFYDNSAYSGPRQVASFHSGQADFEPRWPAWVPPEITSL